MNKYIASRLVAGNRIFPSEIIIDDSGVTLKDPGFFRGKETTIPYSRIASINIDSPMIGFSSITLETTGEGRVHLNGFTKAEVRMMKELILKRI